MICPEAKAGAWPDPDLNLEKKAGREIVIAIKIYAEKTILQSRIYDQ